MYWDSFDCQIQCEEMYVFQSDKFELFSTDEEEEFN